MSLSQCHECGQPMSSSAKACPHCGAAPKYRPSVGFIVVAGLLLVFGIKSVIDSPDTTPPPEKTQAEKDSDWRYQMAGAVVLDLKKRLREPSSLEIIDLYSDDKATTVCLKYRARNGFGGYSIDYLILTENQSHADVAAWNRHCTGEMHDVSAVKHLI